MFTPGLDWALCGYELAMRTVDVDTGELVHKQRLLGEVECIRWGDRGKVLPKHVTVSIDETSASGQATMTDEALFKSVKFGNVNERQFLLSTFGLPDSQLVPPSQAAGSRRRLLFWVLLGNAAVGAVGWYLIKRRTARDI